MNYPQTQRQVLDTGFQVFGISLRYKDKINNLQALLSEFNSELTNTFNLQRGNFPNSEESFSLYWCCAPLNLCHCWCHCCLQLWNHVRQQCWLGWQLQWPGPGQGEDQGQGSRPTVASLGDLPGGLDIGLWDNPSKYCLIYLTKMKNIHQTISINKPISKAGFH